jgi:hypothetical protein
MVSPISSVADEVAKLVKDVLATLASRREVPRDDGAERKTELFFPDGIGDIQVKVTAAGGISIELVIASSPLKVDTHNGSGVKALAHPMDITRDSSDEGDLYLKVSKTGACDTFGDPVKLDKNNIGTPEHVVPCTPD